MSIFFDILLACCDGIEKSEYLEGSFKTNHKVPANQVSLLRQGRLALWNNMRGFKIHNITVSEDTKHIYMDNETFEHRKTLLDEYRIIFNKSNKFKIQDQTHAVNSLNSLIINSDLIHCSESSKSNSFLFNSILENSELKFENNVDILNCNFKSSKIKIEQNSYLSDLNLVSLIIPISCQQLALNQSK